MVRGLMMGGLVAVALAASGCRSGYMLRDPYVLEPCPEDAADPRARSLAALVTAMENRDGWHVEDVDERLGALDARVCRGTRCIPVIFSVHEDGGAYVLRKPGKALSRRWGRTLQGWMRTLERDYAQYRCEARRG